MLEGSLNRGPPRAGLRGRAGVSLTPQTSASSSHGRHHQMPLDASALPPAPLEPAPRPLSRLSPWWAVRGGLPGRVGITAQGGLQC